MTNQGIATVPFADAKNNFSRFVSKVVRDHAPQIVERSRGQEAILVLPLADMPAALAGCRFDAKVSFGDSVVATLPQFGLAASAKDFDSAITRLAEELAEYCEDFFSDFDFYRHTDRIAHLPWLLRFALAPASDRRSLLVDESEEPEPEAEVSLARAR